MSGFRLASPWWLLLLAILPLLWRGRDARERRPAVRFPSLDVLRGVARGDDRLRRLVLGGLRTTVVVLIAFAMARPQAGSAATAVHREGVDVVLSVDVSGSMLAEDFELPSGRHRLAVQRLDDRQERVIEVRSGESQVIEFFFP